jgi:hypothetical protein
MKTTINKHRRFTECGYQMSHSAPAAVMGKEAVWSK